MSRILNNKCAICGVKFNKGYKKNNKDKNNAGAIFDGYVCGACNHYEVLARFDNEFVIDRGAKGGKYSKHIEGEKISQERIRKTKKGLERIAIKMYAYKLNYVEAVERVKDELVEEGGKDE